MAVEYTGPSIKSDGHVLLTGPIQGTVTLEDGTVVDVSQPVIAVSDDQAAEIADLIGKRYAEEGHPDDFEVDEDGNRVPVAFEYVAPEDVPTNTNKD